MFIPNSGHRKKVNTQVRIQRVFWKGLEGFLERFGGFSGGLFAQFYFFISNPCVAPRTPRGIRVASQALNLYAAMSP